MFKTRQLLQKILVCTTLLAGAALAQSTLTQIRDTVTNPDGTPFNGTVVITWNGFTGPSGGTISPLSTSARIYNGALSVLLVPTTTSSAGTYYQAVYNSNDGLVTWTETWQVPPSTTALTLAAVRVTAGGGGSPGGGGTGSGGTGSGGQYATLPISITQVTSLSADLASINSAVAGLTSQVTTLSASIGSTNSTSASFVDDETPAGTVNSTNAVFNLSQTPVPTASLNVYRNGLLQTPGIDYSLSGTTVTFLPVSVPKNSDVISAFYRVTGTGPVTTFVDSETPSGSENGTNLNFSLANAPNPSTSLKLYENGILLNQGSDYTLSGSAITFLNATSAPQASDLLVASYRH